MSNHTERDAIALLPCPFCGGTNLRSGGDDKVVGVACNDCEATGPNHYITGRDWNARAPSPALGGVVAWAYFYDGMLEGDDNPIVKRNRGTAPTMRNEPWTEVPLYAAPPASPAAPVEDDPPSFCVPKATRRVSVTSAPPATFKAATALTRPTTSYRDGLEAVDREALLITEQLVDAVNADKCFSCGQYGFQNCLRFASLPCGREHQGKLRKANPTVIHPAPSYRDGLEAAAKVADEYDSDNANDIASRIRALASDAQPAPVTPQDGSGA